jgi:hypothetical protein
VAWGDNSVGQCNVPATNGGFVAIAAGAYYSLALKADGSITAWGTDVQGSFDIPQPNANYVAVAVGGYTSYALNAYPRVACCRENGVCTMATPDACAALGGVSLGPGSTCDANPCGTSSAREAASGAAPSPAFGASPNPSAGETVIRFALARASAVDLRIYDAAGRLVKGMSFGARPAGQQEIRWDGRDEQGRKAPAGVYLTRITTGDGTRLGRLVIIGR